MNIFGDMNRDDDKMARSCRHYYLEYSPLLLHFAKKFVAAAYAEDLVQDVFLRLWDKEMFLLPEEDVCRILYISIRNACIDHIRRLGNEQTLLEPEILQLKLDELSYFESSEELFMKKDLLQYLLNKIDELPPRSREVFRLAYLENKKSAEIAQQLDLSVRTVENILYRSLLTLRKQCSRLLTFLCMLG